MLFDGIRLAAGSEFQNLVVDSGPAFPVDPNEGEMFYRNDGANEALYIYNGSAWIRQSQAGDNLGDTLPNVVTPGTYTSVTVSEKGFVVGGTSPTTLAGYGINDGQPLDADLTAISAISANSGLLRKTASNTWSLDTATYLTSNQAITVTGDVTGSGTTALNLTLGVTGVAAGTYGNATSVGSFNVTSGGRITAASNMPIVLDTSAITSGTMANARISSASVTQHQTALSITESQITDGSILARVGANETIGGSWTFSAAVSGQTPTAASHLVTKAYADNVAAGVTPQKSVKVATTANITLSGTQTIDGVSVIVGDRVLVKDQTTGSQNGIYVVAAGAWTRSTDFDGNPTTEIQTGSLSYVESGSSNGNSSWILITSGAISVDVTALVFTVFSRAGDYLGGSGLTKTGNTFNINTANSSRIVVGADDIDLATSGVAAGTYSKITVDTYGRATSGANIASGDVTTALGFTPYNASNPSAYITSAGAPVQSVAGRTGSIVLAQADITGLTTASSPTFAALNITGAITGTSFNSITGLSATTPSAAGAAVPGTGTTAARADHVHPLQTSVSGNAGTATTLATGRTFSVSGDATGTSTTFDGSANASIPVTLSTVGTPVTSLFAKITTDTKGRVSGTSAVAQADITGLLGAGSITNTMLANGAVANLSGTNTGDQTISLTGEVTGSGTGSFATTLSNAAVIGKTLTGFTSGAGTITAADTILSAIQKLNANIVANPSGTVTSVAGAGTVNGLTLTGTVTTSGSLTLGGTLSGIANAALTNSLVTVNGTAISLGGSGTVTAAAGTLTGATLAAGVTGSSLTSVGTLTSLNVSGLMTITGARPITLSGGTGTIYSQGDAGGWSNVYGFKGSAGTDRGGFGALGAADALADFWIGASNTTRWMTIQATAASVPGAFTATGAIAGSSVNGITGLSSVVGTTLGTAAIGVATTAARADHIHPLQTTVSGNAGTATALATPRAINGVNFDGTAAITVTAAAGTLTGATLAAGVTASSLTSVGTLTSLTVSGAITGTASGNLPLAGGTMSGIINHGGFVASNAGAPAVGTDLTTKNYVDSAIAGLSWKNSVKVATTVNITLSAPQTIDGVALIAGDRVLVKNQTTTSQNGIYVVAAGAWTRSTDADVAIEVDGSAVYVMQGTTLADTGWTETATVATLGTDPVVYAQFSGSGAYTAGSGLSLVGNTFNNTGVTSITGTANQVSASASTGSITLSLPQSINSGASPTFVGTNFSGTAASLTAGTVTTNANLTGEVTSVGNTATLSNAAVIGKTLTGFTSSAGTITAADTVLSAIQKLNANIVANPSGTVTSVAGAGAVNGLTLTGTVTSSGSLTLGGTLSGIANTALTNSSLTVNGTTISLGGSGTVTAAAGTLTGTTLAAGVTASSLTSVGTLTSLTVSGALSAGSGNVTNNFAVGGYTQGSVGLAISAAGTTQGTATALTKEINVVSTVAATSGVLLPTSAGTTFIVVNAGANALNVYPPTSAAIDSGAINTPLSIPVGSKIMFICVSATQFYTLNATYA